MNEMMQDIDDIIVRLLKSVGIDEPVEVRRLHQRQYDALVKALARYGYTEQETIYDGAYDAEGHFYRREGACQVSCQGVKPYRAFWWNGALEIIHGDCYDNSPEHDQAFLQEMIPVIGKLDAKAHYNPDNGPRLKPNEYRCALCHNVYNKGLTDEEAWKETQQYWPNVTHEECTVVCDECWQKVKPEDHADIYQMSLKDRETWIAKIFGIDLSEPETKAMWDYCGDIMERYQSVQKILIDAWQRLQPTLIHLEKTLRPYYVVTPGYHSRKPKRRSSRGIAVQEKRKKLGLNVDGKYDGIYSYLSRKDAYARAQETVKILVLCQHCKEWFSLRVRRVEVNNYWYKLQSAISCPNCGVQHEAGTQLWWRWK